MSARALYLADQVRRGSKRLAKAVYRRPLISAARIYRALCFDRVSLIGITGSSGKTTTKDLVELILSSRFQAHKSSDTNNSLFSVAETLLRMPRGARICIQELGAFQNEDLGALVALYRPQIGVVTNVAHEHFRAERAAEEKIKLIRALPENGVAVLNADDERVRAMATDARCRVITFGHSANADLRGCCIRSRWPDRLALTLLYENESVECTTQLCGEHLFGCVLAAVAVGLAFGMTLREAVAPIPSFVPVVGRMMPYETTSGITFIRDDWKAPLWSVKAPLDFLRNARAKRKIAVIGTLSDYSRKSSKVYVDVGDAALQSAEHVVFVGPSAHKALRVKQIPEGKTLRAFATPREVAEHLRAFLEPGDLVLLKSSGGDHLARYALMYNREVRCWRERCGRDLMCDNCSLLSVPAKRGQ